MLYLLIGCLIIIGFLTYKLYKKVEIDNERIYRAKQDLALCCHQIETQKKILQQQQLDYYKVEQESNALKEKINDQKKELFQAQNIYNDLVETRMKALDEIVEETSQKRMEQLQETFEEAKSKYNLQLKEYETKRMQQMKDVEDSCIEAENRYFEECKKIKEDTEYMRQQYEALLEPIKQYLKDKQEKYFYTIQLPEEFQDDIEFLLTTVAAKVQHPDIISKLVWAEYVKPNLDNTFKRIEIKAEPGIYKLTSLENGMAYIGKSTDVKKRIADHFKSSIGIRSIADQAVHHAILKEGFWNWSIEIITYADKDKLNELEKYYIEFFKTQEFGYNKNSGGGG